MTDPQTPQKLLAESALTGPTLHPWQIRPEVADLQELLCAHGFPLQVDGNFGYRTEDAVRRFQRRHRLRADGVVGSQTWATLKGNLQPGQRILKLGHSGSDVYELQGLLRIQGHDIRRDGIFDQATEAAVRSFQAQHKLKISGIVDSTTWTLLGGGSL